MAWNMNKQRGAHLAGKSMEEYSKSDDGASEQPAEHETHGDQGHQNPQIHIHSHSNGHTVHIMHHDGAHEKHEHSHGDSEGISAHIHEHLGQDHGGSSAGDQEDEFGSGPGV